MSVSESQLRADIVEVGRRLYARGYTASNDGNISVRLDAGRLLMTPTSVCKGFMTPDMMCITDLAGRKLTFTKVKADEEPPRDPWGCMAGTVTILPGTDLTAPSEIWNAEARRHPND